MSKNNRDNNIQNERRVYGDVEYEIEPSREQLEGRCCVEQRHVHEFEGSTKLSEIGEDRHNHRFAGVTCEAMPCENSHVHKLATRTDFFDHFHIIEDTTGPAICVGKGKHVHFVSCATSVNDGHRHAFQFATLIESPLV